MSLTDSSQTQRIIEGGRGCWRTSGPTHLLKQGHLEVVAQDCVQRAFAYLHMGDSTLRATFASTWSSSWWKSVPDVQSEPPVLLCAHCPVAGHHWKDPGSVVFANLPSGYVDKFPLSLSLLISRPNSPTFLSFFSYEKWSSPLNIFMALGWTLCSSSMSVLYWESTRDTLIKNVVQLGRWYDGAVDICWDWAA